MNKLINNINFKQHTKSLIFLILSILFCNKLNILHNRVIYTNIFLIFISIFLFEITNNKIYLLLWLAIYILNEILYLFLNIDLYPSGSRTELVYSSPTLFNKIFKYKNTNINNSLFYIDTNLTESIFKNDKCISSSEGEKNRFDYFIELLNIKKNESVLDAGCGHGNMVKYMRDKGIEAYGITITKIQYMSNKQKYGDYFYFGDYTKYHKELTNKFDHIILPGSLEHPFGGNPFYISSYKNKYNKMIKMFSIFKKYFKKNSKQKKILTTCIHMHNPNNKLYKPIKNKIIIYFIERVFGGLYPLYEKYGVKDSLKKSGFKVLNEFDKTWDYYYSSYCDINHFGNPYNISPIILLFLPFNQFVFHCWIYLKYGLWLWMWSNRLHKRRNENEKFCDKNKTCDLYYEKDFNKRPCSLLYTIAKLE